MPSREKLFKCVKRPCAAHLRALHSKPSGMFFFFFFFLLRAVWNEDTDNGAHALSWPSELWNHKQRALRLQANFIEKEFTYIE